MNSIILGKTKDVVKIGGRFGGFRTLSTRSCSGIEAELIETNRKGISTLLTKYEISEIKEACEVSQKNFHNVCSGYFLLLS